MLCLRNILANSSIYDVCIKGAGMKKRERVLKSEITSAFFIFSQVSNIDFRLELFDLC